MRQDKVHTISEKMFADMFGVDIKHLPSLTKKAIKQSNFRYQIIDSREYDEAILRILKTLFSDTVKTAGPHRLLDWEKGWGENLQDFTESNYDLHQLIPKFVKKGEYIRFQGHFIKTESDSFETDFVTVMRYFLFIRYFKEINTLYEFGAGTGLNLVAASEIFPNMKLVGLDWAQSSVDIVSALQKKLHIPISGKKFNLFNPEKNYLLDKNAGVLTIGTLEQLGSNFEPFIRFLLANKPQVCIHIETIYEVYNQDNLFDYLAAKYLEKRNYLQGFLSFLQKLEKKKIVKILDVRRTFGSFYHDGYTYIVWRLYE